MAPKIARGFSINQIEQHGNNIYAIPIKTYVGPSSFATLIYYWVVIERDNKVYAMGFEEARLADFQRAFKQR